MRGKIAGAVMALAALAAGIGWWLSEPVRLTAGDVLELGQGDATRGKRIFYAGGCTSCHARPKAEGEARLELVGGLELKTEFGTFVAPNISQDKADGIGAWSMEDFANAMMRGVSPAGKHLYPAFPYTSYARMKLSDVADLYAFLKTLPAVPGKAAAPSLSFPFNVRRGIGLWKQLYLDSSPVVVLAADGLPDVLAGRYLVEGPGHCGECHTPRDMFGGTKKGEWLAGAKAAEGGGVVPNITGGEGGIGDWSAADIANYLETGFTPEFDSAGGAMADVQENMAKLTPQDRAAIAAYLKAIPAHKDGYPAPKPQS
ncbi:cytochrome C [Mesorhizobium loti]|nr:cytochrome c [Mesorhizobium loti]PLP59687.1 cytochrome C [Mesorhizobium loti]